ncbi:MAG: hypothetical protein JKY70_11070 [Mucilaginibacter sp.]|nr:hypothetical protein [Mucilaginibacter sp.]
MNFISKLYIFTNLLEQANKHKASEDPTFEGFGQYVNIVNPKNSDEDGQLYLSADADVEARFILTMIWDEAMNNFEDYKTLVSSNRVVTNVK